MKKSNLIACILLGVSLSGCGVAEMQQESKMTPDAFAQHLQLQSITFTQKDIDGPAFQHFAKQEPTNAAGFSNVLMADVLLGRAGAVNLGQQHLTPLSVAMTLDPHAFVTSVPAIPLLGLLLLSHGQGAHYPASEVGSLNFYYPPSKADPIPNATKLLVEGIKIMEMTHEGVATGPMAFRGYVYSVKGRTPFDFSLSAHMYANPYGFNFDDGYDTTAGLPDLDPGYSMVGVFFNAATFPVSVMTGVTPGMKLYTMAQIQAMYRHHPFLKGWWAVFNTRLSSGQAVWVVYDGAKVVMEVKADQTFHG